MRKLIAVLVLLTLSFSAFSLARETLIVNDKVVFRSEEDTLDPEIEFAGKVITASKYGDEYTVQIDEVFIDHISEGSYYVVENIKFRCCKTNRLGLVLSFTSGENDELGYVLAIAD